MPFQVFACADPLGKQEHDSLIGQRSSVLASVANKLTNLDRHLQAVGLGWYRLPVGRSRSVWVSRLVGLGLAIQPLIASSVKPHLFP